MWARGPRPASALGIGIPRSCFQKGQAGESRPRPRPSGAALVAKLSCLLREGTASGRRRELPRATDRGCERAGGGAGCHAGFRGAWALAAGDGSEPSVPGPGAGDIDRFVCMCSQERCAGSRDCGPVASLNSSCRKKTGARCCYKSGLWIELRRAIDLPRLSIGPQRSPTVRRSSQLGNGEERTKTRAKWWLRIHRAFKVCAIARDSHQGSVEISPLHGRKNCPLAIGMVRPPTRTSRTGPASDVAWT